MVKNEMGQKKKPNDIFMYIRPLRALAQIPHTYYIKKAQEYRLMSCTQAITCHVVMLCHTIKLFHATQLCYSMPCNHAILS